MSKIAAYIRVSTPQQDYETQRDSIARVAAARGDAIDDWFEEKVSAANKPRPELNRLRADAHCYRRVYVFRLDRLSRGGIGETLNIVKELRQYGCDVVSVCEHWNFEGPMGELLLSVIAWAAQQERRALTSRLEAARERALANGGSWGRPKVLLADTIRLARALIAEGHSVRSAARELGISHSTLARAVSQNHSAPPSGDPGPSKPRTKG